jgi:hypothetical protein
MKNQNLQTATQWLIEKITLKKEGDVIYLYPTISKEDIKQAEQMDKDNIVNSWDLSRRDIDYPANGEQYYNQNFVKKETNYEIGYRMKMEGYGVSDSMGSVACLGYYMSANPNNEPTNEEIEEWMRGYNAAKAELEEKKTSLNLESLEQKLDNALEIETTESLTEFVNKKRGEQVKDLAYWKANILESQCRGRAYWKANAEEDYITTPISVLRYIVELEAEVLKTANK